mmetsp:Transcript_7452/g.9733  ORF Transcript_7452/g.9733 Transcript_7452/m.9733 type:complete len:161 (-) Transcript_7452:342-824(-)
MNVDQSASILLMSLAQARREGIEESKLIFIHGTADTTEKETLARPELHRSPAARVLGQELERSAGIDLKQVRYKDIYSCFPIAVSVVAIELGLDLKDTLTTTGGHPYHGGPGSHYTLHGIAAMVELLRKDPGSFGLVTANGGVLSKQSGMIFLSYGVFRN